MPIHREQRLDNRWLFICYLGLLIWVPIPLGSNRPWSWAILELWVFGLATWWLVNFLRGKSDIGPVFRHARPALLCASLWLAYVWLQLVPLPGGLLQILSPEAARLHAAAGNPSDMLWAPLTVDRYATLAGALKSSAYVAFFALTLMLLQRSRRISATAYTLVISGFLQAMYGGVVSLAAYGADAHGTYVHRNHYAAYLVMCMSIGLGLLLSSLGGDTNKTWKQFLRNTLEWLLSRKMLLRLALVVMVTALILTRSRMGNSSFFISLLASGGLALLLARHATRSMVIVITSLIIIDIFILGAYFGVERVLTRIENTSIETEDRDDVAGYALNLWKDYPVFGAGLGSFGDVYPRYRGGDIGELFTHAHDDYLQFACETGLIGLALLGILVALSFIAAVRAQFVRRDPLMRGISFGAMMSMVAFAIHSTVDFNLQIPANALTMTLVLALGWISLYHGADRRSRGERGNGAGSPGESDAPDVAEVSTRTTRKPA